MRRPAQGAADAHKRTPNSSKELYAPNLKDEGAAIYVAWTQQGQKATLAFWRQDSFCVMSFGRRTLEANWKVLARFRDIERHLPSLESHCAVF